MDVVWPEKHNNFSKNFSNSHFLSFAGLKMAKIGEK